MAISLVGIWSGFGSVCTILPGELAPEGIRAITAAAASLFTWIPAFIILMVFPQVEKSVGSYSYLPFIFCGVLIGAFVFIYMPETKGRAVDEIIEPWVEKTGPETANDERTPLLNHKP